MITCAPVPGYNIVVQTIPTEYPPLHNAKETLIRLTSAFEERGRQVEKAEELQKTAEEKEEKLRAVMEKELMELAELRKWKAMQK